MKVRSLAAASLRRAFARSSLALPCPHARTPSRALLFASLIAPLRRSAAALPTRSTGFKARGELVWGGDAEGGGPYVYPDPAHPKERIGFEVELADALAAQLGAKAEFKQGGWDDLPGAARDSGQIDMVLNGYELTATRAGRMRATSPYYVFRFVLMAPSGTVA